MDYLRESPQPANSYLRVTNASPDAPSVDVYANEKLIAQNLKFKDISPYTALTEGKYSIKIYPAGSRTKLLIGTTADIASNSVYNLAVMGIEPDIFLYLIPEPAVPENFGRPCIRFINLSPDLQDADIIMADGTKLFENVGYKGATLYACIPEGTYSMMLGSHNANNILVSMPGVDLRSNTYYTLYAVGHVGGTPPLTVLLVPEPR